MQKHLPSENFWLALQIDLAHAVQVVCATCAGAGDDERLQMRRYKMVIIDEATQATEPSNIIPLVRSTPFMCCGLSWMHALRRAALLTGAGAASYVGCQEW